MTTTIETAPLVPGTVILDEEVGARGKPREEVRATARRDVDLAGVDGLEGRDECREAGRPHNRRRAIGQL